MDIRNKCRDRYEIDLDDIMTMLDDFNDKIKALEEENEGLKNKVEELEEENEKISQELENMALEADMEEEE